MDTKNVLRASDDGLASGKDRRADIVSRRKKPLKAGEQGHLSVSLPADVLLAIDEAATELSGRHGYTVRRSDVVLKALREWLAAYGDGGKTMREIMAANAARSVEEAAAYQAMIQRMRAASGEQKPSKVVLGVPSPPPRLPRKK